MHSKCTQRWECIQRHPDRPSFLLEDTASLVSCLICATLILRDHVGNFAQVRVVITRLSQLEPNALRSAAQEDSAVLEDLTGSLLFSLENVSKRGNTELSCQTARLLLFIALACDGRELSDDVLSGRIVDESSSSVELRSLGVLVERLFCMICGGDDVHESSSLSFATLPAFTSLALTAIYLLLGNVNWVDGIPAGVRTAIFCSIAERIPNIKLLCAVLLEYMGTYSGGTLDSLSETAYLLCAVLSTNRQDVVDFVWSSYHTIFETLRIVERDCYRESILALATVFLSQFTSHERFSGAQLEMTASGCPEILPDESSFTWTRPQCSAVADALKACSLSRSSVVQWLSFRIIAIICTNNQCESAGSDLVPSGYVDFLLESLRSDHRCGIEAQDSVDKHPVSVPCLKSLAVVSKKYSKDLRSKWAYGIPIVIRAAAMKLDDAVIGSAFEVLILALQPTFSPPVPLDSDVKCALMRLVLHSGSKLSLLSTKGSHAEKEVQHLFVEGIEALRFLLQSCRFGVPEIPLLLSCVECAGLLVPTSQGASMLARITVDYVLGLPVDDLTEDTIQCARKALLETWAAACSVEMSAGSPSISKLSFLLNGLYTVACALDPRYFVNSPVEEQANARLWLWEVLSPNLVFDYLGKAQAGYHLGIHESSDTWMSSGENDVDVNVTGGGVEFGTSDGQEIRFYLSRLICCEKFPFPFSDITPRAFEKHVPSSTESLRVQMRNPAGPEQFLIIVLLLQQTMVNAGGCILSGEEISAALIHLTESGHHVLNDTACSLQLCRLLFKLDSLRQAVDGFVLRAELCRLLLTSAEFDFSISEDKLCLLHIIEHANDTQLRIQAWLVYGKKWHELNSYGRAFPEQQIVNVLTRNPGAAKCLVSSLREGTCHVREMVFELCLAFPREVAAALDNVGLPAALQSMLERLFCYDRTAIMPAEYHGWEKSTSEMIEIVNLKILQIGSAGLHIMLMRLVDVFARTAGSISGANSAPQMNATAGSAKSVCTFESVYAQSWTCLLDLSILRCLITFLNQPLSQISDRGNNFHPQILDYIYQSRCLEKLTTILLRGAEPVDGRDNTSSSEAGDFIVAAAATLLDYFLRYEAQVAAFKVTQHLQRLVLVLSKHGASIELHISGSNRKRHSYSVACIQIASIRLYTTWLRISNLPGIDVKGPEVSPYLLILMIDLASSASSLSADAASQLLQGLLRVHSKESPCLSRKSVFEKRQLSSERVLLQYLLVKFCKSPGYSSYSELNYLAFAFETANIVGEEGKCFVDALLVLLSERPRRNYFLNQETVDTCTSILNRSSSSCTDHEWGALKTAIQLLEVDVSRTNRPENSGIDRIAWRTSGILLGRTAVLSAPIADW
jgi:hypothetical protein